MRRPLYLIIYIVILATALAGCTMPGERSRMRAGLDSLNQRNRNDEPFTVQEADSFVRFFDKHGSPNDRLLAHYLLGRAHHEAGHAPEALQCYHDALDQADTTAADCDYAQLSRVYAQMAEVFYHQDLHRQELEYGILAEDYAWKAQDTLVALINRELQNLAYYGLGLVDSAIFIVEDVAKRYDQLGYHKDAAITIGTIVKTLIERGEYKKARSYMERYESNSGYFDSSGDIAQGREIYYKLKGLYYLNNNRLDSAEYYFRKELRDGKDYNNQHAAARGLVMLYKKQNRTDSVAKYAQYAYDMNDSIYAQKTTKEVRRVQAMYDYTRNQELARKESERANQANHKLSVSIIALLITSLLASWLYFARKQVVENLRNTSAELSAVREELLDLQQNELENQQSIIENKRRIKQLEQKLGKYGKLVYFGAEKVENHLLLSPRYQKIKGMAYKGQGLQDSDWDNIYQLISEYFPGYNDFLVSKLKVTSIEYQVCQLFRLHFKAGEIANMLSVSPPYISKISTSVYAILFGKKGSSRELTRELGKIN